MSAAVPVRHRRRVRRVSGPGLRLQGTEAGQLVHPRPHRAGGSRSRIREPHQPVHLGAFRADLRPGEDRTRRSPGSNVYGLIWTTTPWTIPANMAIAFHPEVRVRRRRGATARVYIVAAELLERHRRKMRLERAPQSRRLPGRRARTRRLPPSLPRTRFARHSRRPRHARTGHRRGPHRSRPRPGGLRHRPQYGMPTYCPVDAAGRFFHAEGAAGTLARGTHRQDGLGSQPDRHRDPEASTARCWPRRRSTHSYPHCWRCHNPTIFRATEQWFIGMDRNDLRQQRARSHQAGHLDARPGARSASPT